MKTENYIGHREWYVQFQSFSQKRGNNFGWLKEIQQIAIVNVSIIFYLKPPKCHLPNENKMKDDTHKQNRKVLLLPSWSLICKIV